MPEKDTGKGAIWRKRITKVLLPWDYYESKELPSKITLEEAAIHTRFQDNHAISDTVTSIELGKLKGFGDSLVNETIKDPSHREQPGVIRVKKRAYRKPFVYAKRVSSIGKKSSVFQILRTDNSSMKNVGSVHTHPVEFPPAPYDLVDLLTAIYPLPTHSFSWGFLFIPTVNRASQQPGFQYLVFRGEKTPQLTASEATAHINSFYTSQLPEGAKPAVQGFHLFQSKKDRKDEEEFFHALDEDPQLEQETRVEQEVFLMELAEKLDLKVFRVEPGETVARRLKLVTKEPESAIQPS